MINCSRQAGAGRRGWRVSSPLAQQTTHPPAQLRGDPGCRAGSLSEVEMATGRTRDSLDGREDVTTATFRCSQDTPCPQLSEPLLGAPNPPQQQTQTQHPGRVNLAEDLQIVSSETAPWLQPQGGKCQVELEEAGACPSLSTWLPTPAPGPGQTRPPGSSSVPPSHSLLFRGHRRMQSQAWGTHTRSSPPGPLPWEHLFPRGLVG